MPLTACSSIAYWLLAPLRAIGGHGIAQIDMLVFLLLPWAQGFLFAAIAEHQGAILLDARDLPLAVGDMAMLIDGAGKADLIPSLTWMSLG